MQAQPIVMDAAIAQAGDERDGARAPVKSREGPACRRRRALHKQQRVYAARR
jgi:hypothetical protein